MIKTNQIILDAVESVISGLKEVADSSTTAAIVKKVAQTSQDVTNAIKSTANNIYESRHRFLKSSRNYAECMAQKQMETDRVQHITAAVNEKEAAAVSPRMRYNVRSCYCCRRWCCDNRYNSNHRNTRNNKLFPGNSHKKRPPCLIELP